MNPLRSAIIAGMTGLAVLGGCSPAPAPPEVALLDVFPSQGETTHGKLVAATLQQELGPRAFETLQVDLGDDMRPIEQGRPGALDAYVEQRLLVPTQQTADRLAQLARTHRRYVVGQSQGASDARVVDALWQRAADSPSFRAALSAQLGLPSSASDHDLLASLVTRVERDHAASAAVRQAHAELVEQAGRLAPGSIRLLSAGNQGLLSERLTREGIEVNPRFYRSELEDPQAIIVGAADGHATPDHADDTAAAIASPNAGAMVAANGVDQPVVVDGRPGLYTGSSFAQPQVTAWVERLLVDHPEMTPDQVKHRLVDSTHALPAARDRVGAGVVDEGWLLAPARR